MENLRIMRKVTSTIVFFLLLFSISTFGQNPNVKFVITPEQPTLQLHDTIQFSLVAPDGSQPDSVFFYADQGQSILMQMGFNLFYAKRVGKSIITCNAYVNGQLYRQTTNATVVDQSDPEPQKLRFAQREISVLLDGTAPIQLFPEKISNVRFEVKDESIASLDADFTFIKGVRPGITNIYAYWNNQVATCLIKVLVADSLVPDVLTILPNPIEINLGSSIPVEIISKSLTALPISSKVENPNIADFDETGMLFGKSIGRTWLHAQQGESSARALITVSAVDTVQPRGIQIIPNPIKIKEGTQDKVQLITPYSIPFYFSSADPSIARVSKYGTIYGVKSGITLIVAQQGNFVDTALVEIVKNTVDPEFEEVNVEMSVSQVTSLKRLFLRFSDNMRMEIYSEGVIQLDGNLNVYAVKEGKATIVFYNTDHTLVFYGFIWVKGEKDINKARVKDIWLEDENTIKIKFSEAIAFISDSLLMSMVKVEVFSDDNVQLKNGIILDIKHAQLTENNTVLTLTLSRGIVFGETVKVSVQKGIMNNEALDTEKLEFMLPSVVISANDVPEENIRIFPNPATYALNIQSITPIHSLKIYDLRGKSLAGYLLGGEKEYHLDVTFLNNGTFLLVVTDQNKKVFKTTFIKQ